MTPDEIEKGLFSTPEEKRLWLENERMKAALMCILQGETMRGKGPYTLGDVIQQHYKIAREALGK